MDSKCRKAIFKALFEDIYKENQCKGKNFTHRINLKTRKLMVDLHVLLFKDMIVKIFENLIKYMHYKIERNIWC